MKRISKEINSEFNPTIVGGYPIYAYGGKMYGFGSWLKSNSGNLLQTGLGIGAMFIPGMQGVGASMIGNGVTGLATTGDTIGDQQKAMYAQQREALKQMQLDKISNLPGQQYSESQQTMAAGGNLSRSKDYGSKKKPYPSVKSSDFAGGKRSYPIPTKADAVDALRLAGLHGRSDVKTKVFKKYPGLKKAYGGSLKGAPQGKATAEDIEIFKQKYPEEMAMGTHVEYEHTKNKRLAERIAADHIKDFEKMYGGPGYYQSLKDFGLTDELAYGGKTNSYAKGGKLSKPYGGTIGDLDFTTFLNTGGTHETNPNGGIPIGKNALVEEGEYIWDGPDGKYVFSNRF